MTQMKDTIRIGLAGVGTVGSAVLRLVEDYVDILQSITGKQIEITALAVEAGKIERQKQKISEISQKNYRYYDVLTEMAQASDLDVIIELIGGTSDVIMHFLCHALRHNKHVVTANKAILAERGQEIFQCAHDTKMQIRFEAAVIACIPIIHTLTNSAFPLHPQKIVGICNGTCNYILSTMQQTKRDFADILVEAQEIGYAEADPTLDVEGIDSAHKIVILARMIFGVSFSFQDINISGIRNVSLQDIEIVKHYGYHIKLLGVARIIQDGENKQLLVYVGPTLISEHTNLAQIESATNALVVTDAVAGEVFMSAAGAGGNETASAVLGDVVAIANNTCSHPLRYSMDALNEISLVHVDTVALCYYVRLVIENEAEIENIQNHISQEFSLFDIHIKSLTKHRDTISAQKTNIVIFTHAVSYEKLLNILNNIEKKVSFSIPFITMIVDG